MNTKIGAHSVAGDDAICDFTLNDQAKFVRVAGTEPAMVEFFAARLKA